MFVRRGVLHGVGMVLSDCGRGTRSIVRPTAQDDGGPGAFASRRRTSSRVGRAVDTGGPGEGALPHGSICGGSAGGACRGRGPGREQAARQEDCEGAARRETIGRSQAGGENGAKPAAAAASRPAKPAAVSAKQPTESPPAKDESASPAESKGATELELPAELAGGIRHRSKEMSFDQLAIDTSTPVRISGARAAAPATCPSKSGRRRRLLSAG